MIMCFSSILILFCSISKKSEAVKEPNGWRNDAILEDYNWRPFFWLSVGFPLNEEKNFKEFYKKERLGIVLSH